MPTAHGLPGRGGAQGIDQAQAGTAAGVTASRPEGSTAQPGALHRARFAGGLGTLTRRPASAQAGLDCLVQVRQTATGDVISANVVSCNGDEAVKRSIVAAVHKASPLPLPENQLLFDPNLRFRFIPEQ